MGSMDFRGLLERDGKFVYTSRGRSMVPLIREGKDLVVIERAALPLKKYDVPLYQRANGDTILHRVLQVRPDGYVLCGDSQCNLEYGVQDAQVIGVLSAVIRNGKECSVRDWRYRAYVRLWGGCRPVRFPVLRGMALVRRAAGGIIRRISGGKKQ